MTTGNLLDNNKAPLGGFVVMENAMLFLIKITYSVRFLGFHRHNEYY